MKLIKGNKYIDARGELTFVNEMEFSDVKRFYLVKHPDTKVLRAWQGHKEEGKYFMCIKGAFKIAVLNVNDWISPSKEIAPKYFTLSEDDVQILHVPKGHVTGFKALVNDSSMLVYSTSTLEESKNDHYRFDKDYWKFEE